MTVKPQEVDGVSTHPVSPASTGLAERAPPPTGKAEGGAIVHSIVPAAAPERPEPAAPPAPQLADFLGGEDTRLRDLLAFGMAAQAGGPLGPEAVPALRRKADAELQAHAFRLLHNQVETIRRQAVDEQLARGPRGLSFNQAVAANLAALVLAGALAVLGWLASPLFHGR